MHLLKPKTLIFQFLPLQYTENFQYFRKRDRSVFCLRAGAVLILVVICPTPNQRSLYFPLFTPILTFKNRGGTIYTMLGPIHLFQINGIQIIARRYTSVFKSNSNIYVIFLIFSINFWYHNVPNFKCFNITEVSMSISA